MKLKRLKHQSYILCHMFCGWQLYPDWKTLAKLGQGLLEIDVLNESCKFDSRDIPRLSILGVLRDWLLEDLETNRIPLSVVETAKLIVQLNVGSQKRRRGIYDYEHDFLLEGVVGGKGRKYRTKFEYKSGHQRIIESGRLL